MNVHNVTYLVIKNHVVYRPFLWSSILDIVDEDAFDEQAGSCDTSQEKCMPAMPTSRTSSISTNDSKTTMLSFPNILSE